MINNHFKKNLITRFFVFALFSLLLAEVPSVSAQQLSASFAAGNGQYNSETFWLQDQPVLLNDRYLSFMNSGRQVSGFLAYGLAADYSSIAVLERGVSQAGLLQLTMAGDTLNSFDVEGLEGNDPSLALYPQGDGTVMLRKNIAGFSQFDVFGHEKYFVSNSSQSQGGEVISEVATTPDGRATLLYNPKIMRDGKAGSAARVLEAGGEHRSVFYSDDRTIASADIASSGSAIALLTRREGTNDQIFIVDRFGRQLRKIETEEDLVGINLSDEGRYLTIWARGRIQVYRTTDGKRLGSTSSRTPVVWADYAPDDGVVVAIMGRHPEGSNKVGQPEIQAVHFGKREIVNDELDDTIGMSDKLPIRIVRSSRYHYRIEGINRPVNVSMSF